MDNIDIIVNEFKEKNYDHFDEFYHETKKLVYYMITSTIKDGEIANDVMQDVYVKFLNNIDKVSSKQNPVAYLAQIARNAAINEYHKNKRMTYDDEYISTLKDENSHINHKVDLGIIDYLKNDDREIVYLHIVADLKFREIANILDIPLGTVLWKYNKSIKYLRKKVGEIDEK